ncbi:hypothetical protein TcCL_NonESM02072 [Trypanosoma cruzi]|nr:hypothetical protein TcCL_NonESM02072 [Trypanosoma cruzi]
MAVLRITAVVNRNDTVVGRCFYRFVSILSGCFQEFFPFHADCVEGDRVVALVTADVMLYRTVIPWSCVRGTQRSFCAMEKGFSEPPSGSNELQLCLTADLHARGITVLRSKAATE